MTKIRVHDSEISMDGSGSSPHQDIGKPARRWGASYRRMIDRDTRVWEAVRRRRLHSRSPPLRRKSAFNPPRVRLTRALS